MDAGVVKISEICPPTTSASAGAAPLYGICRISTFAARLNSSRAKWLLPPEPDEPPVSSPGLAFASAIKSLTVDAEKSFRVLSIKGADPSEIT